MSYDPSSEGNQGWQGGQQPPPPYSQGYGQQPPPGWGQGAPTGPAGFGGPSGPQRGLFGALFDYGFTSFATPSVIKVLYILGTVLIGVGYLFGVIVSFSQSALAGIGVLIFGALIALIYLIFLRVTLEFYFAVVRMSEDIHSGRR